MVWATALVVTTHQQAVITVNGVTNEAELQKRHANFVVTLASLRLKFLGTYPGIYATGQGTQRGVPMRVELVALCVEMHGDAGQVK